MPVDHDPHLGDHLALHAHVQAASIPEEEEDEDLEDVEEEDLATEPPPTLFTPPQSPAPVSQV